MTRRLPQSTAYTAVFKVFLSSDHVSAATGKTVAITISKAGAAFGNPAAGASNATEISGGWYKFALGTGDTDTLGDLILVGTATSCDTADIVMMVVAATNGGLTALPAVAAEASGGLYTRGTGAGQINQDANGRVDANVKTWIGGTIPAVNVTGVPLVDLKYTLGTISPATAGSVRADSVTGAVGSVTGLTASNLDAAISTVSTLTQANVRTAVGLASANLDTQLTAIDDYIDTEVAAIKAKTDNLPASPAATGDAMTLTSGERNSVADALLDRSAGVETGLTPRQWLRLAASVLFGKASGLATATAVYRDFGDSKDRITAAVDANGNRSAVTRDAT